MNEDDTEPKSSREEWDSPITFTAKSSRKCFHSIKALFQAVSFL